MPRAAAAHAGRFTNLTVAGLGQSSGTAAACGLALPGSREHAKPTKNLSLGLGCLATGKQDHADFESSKASCSACRVLHRVQHRGTGRKNHELLALTCTLGLFPYRELLLALPWIDVFRSSSAVS